MGTKTLYQAFDEEQYAELLEVKGSRTWETAILQEFGIEDNE